MNDDGTYDWGLFQINDGYWCQVGRPGKGCNIECNGNLISKKSFTLIKFSFQPDLLKDNISKAAACAKIIYKAHGFYAWVAWKNKCNGKPLPNINECF